MKPRKLDRFERIVRKEQRHDDWGIAVVSAEDVINLLRKEHAWVRGMVKSYDQPYDEHVNADYQRGYFECVTDILERLAQRRKRGER